MCERRRNQFISLKTRGEMKRSEAIQIVNEFIATWWVWACLWVRAANHFRRRWELPAIGLAVIDWQFQIKLLFKQPRLTFHKIPADWKYSTNFFISELSLEHQTAYDDVNDKTIFYEDFKIILGFLSRLSLKRAIVSIMQLRITFRVPQALVSRRLSSLHAEELLRKSLSAAAAATWREF